MDNKYTRVVIKISGEALAGENGFGLNNAVIAGVVEQIGKDVKIDNREIRQHDKPEKVFYKLFRKPFDVRRNRKIYEHVEKPRRPDEYRVYEKHRDY